MPLLDLKTDLKSLKYGQDQPGGGSSGQPYIKTDINTVDSGLNRLRFTKFDDGLIRGGAVGTANAAIVDTLRIGKFLTDAPQGPLFIVKQVGLQLSNPRLESTTTADRPISGQGFLNNAINFVSNVATRIENEVGPTRIYNLGINTLAQVPVNAIGGHIMRHGLLPNNDDSKLYYNVVTEKNFINNTNRLVNLKTELDIQAQTFFRQAQPRRLQPPLIRQEVPGENQYISVLNEPDPDPNMVPGTSALYFPERQFLPPKIELKGRIPSLSYTGGPNSVYGIGYTDIKRGAVTSYNTNEGLFRDIARSTTNNLTRTQEQEISSEALNLITIADTGVSRQDERLQKYINPENTDIKSTPRDFTAVKYESVIPSLRTYAELVKQIDLQKDPKRTDKIGKDANNNEIYVNQFGTYNTGSFSTDPTLVKNGKIGYKNSYGDVITIKTSTWSDVSRENRIGDFGEAQTKILNVSGSTKTFTTKTVNRADSVNLTPLFEREKYWSGDGGSLKSDWVAINGVNYNTRDLVKFRIQAINTDSPDLGNYMVFRALLTSFSDSVDSQWNDIKYAGRGNPFYIYTGFTRKISVGFKVAALSAEEMRPMYSKLNYLMASLMPDYDSNLMRGPLHRLTVGNYLDSQFGKLDSVSYTIPNDSPWEIALDEPEGGTRQLILPHIIEVQMNFTPIGAETQRVNKIEAKTKDDSTSFIAQNNTGADAETIQYYSSFYKP